MKVCKLLMSSFQNFPSRADGNPEGNGYSWGRASSSSQGEECSPMCVKEFTDTERESEDMGGGGGVFYFSYISLEQNRLILSIPLYFSFQGGGWSPARKGSTSLLSIFSLFLSLGSAVSRVL